MTVKEAIKKAIETRNATMAAGVADKLRLKGLNYNDTIALVNRVMERDCASEWETLMYEADSGY